MDWIYGIHAVHTMLKSSPQRVKELHVQRGRTDDRLQKIHKLAEQHGVTLQWATSKRLDEKAEGRHQGVMALCSPGQTYDENFLLNLAEEKGGDAFFLMLDGVTDPHNLGARPPGATIKACSLAPPPTCTRSRATRLTSRSTRWH